MKFSLWVQDLDYNNVVDEMITSASPAINLLNSYDWLPHLQRFEASGGIQGEACPPVLGITDQETDSWITLLPQSNGGYHISWNMLSEKGDAQAATGDRQGVDHANAEFAIRCFMARDVDWLLENV